MIIDLDLYAVNKRFVQEWFEKNKESYDLGYCISNLAIMTMCPVIVIAYWIGDLTGWPPEVITKIERLKEFYGYTHISNKPPGSP